MAELITVREFARREGCDEKKVRRGLAKGLLSKDSEGLLDAGQVGNGWRKTNRRGRASAAADNPPSVRTNVRSRDVRGSEEDEEADGPESPAAAAERIALTAAPFNRIEAERIKENYLALLKKLEFEQKEGSLIELSMAERVLFEGARAMRDAWLNWPARVGPLLAADLGLEADRVTEALTEHVHKHIAQLGEPDVDFKGE